MPDLVSKIIESYFSIKELNKKIPGSTKTISVKELSSGEKRKALIDLAYSFLKKNSDRNSNLIIAIDEPESSLHVSSCYQQFEKLIEIAKENHQVLITTHWYGFLPIVTEGTATSINKSLDNKIFRSDWCALPSFHRMSYWDHLPGSDTLLSSCLSTHPYRYKSPYASQSQAWQGSLCEDPRHSMNLGSTLLVGYHLL